MADIVFDFTVAGDYDFGSASFVGDVELVNTSGGAITVTLLTGTSYINTGPNITVTLEDAPDLLAVEQAIKFASFQSAVWIDTGSSQTGTGYPSGNRQFPVNNVPDAVAIAAANGLHNLEALSDLTLGTGDDVSDFELSGISRLATNITVESAAVCDGLRVNRCTFSGILDGDAEISDCYVGNITYVSGQIDNCGLTGTIVLSGNQEAVIANCYSIDQDLTTIIDMGGSGQDLSMPNFNGLVDIRNLTSATEEIGIGLNAGAVILENTITAGTVVISGIGIVDDQSGPLVSVNTDSLVSKALIASAVWDSLLTGDTFNLPTSAGRRLRGLSGAIIIEGTAKGSTVNTITLDVNSSSVDGAYDPTAIAITGGTGYGQSRLIFQYDGTTKIAVVDRDWKEAPDETSEYVITTDPGREHINEGLATGGDTQTITLNPLASSYDGVYVGQTIFLRSGTGQDQACKVTTYDGATKVATICKPWSVVPDNTTGYVVLPAGYFSVEHLAASLLTHGIASEASASAAASAGSFLEKIVNNKREIAKNGDVWELIVYDDDDITPILTKTLKDSYGNNITDLAAGVLAVENAHV